MSKILDDLQQKASQVSYKRGTKYYKKKKTEMITIKSDKKEIKIIGFSEGSYNEIYGVDITLNQKTGNIISCNCSCPAFAEFPGICKHIVALGLEFDELDRRKKFIGRKDTIEYNFLEEELEEYDEFDFLGNEKLTADLNSVNQLEKLYREIIMNGIQQPQNQQIQRIKSQEEIAIEELKLNLDKLENSISDNIGKTKFNLDVKIQRGYTYYTSVNLMLKLKAGEDKTFYIKDLLKFCEAVLFDNEYEITSKVKYSPKENFFNEEDVKILKVIRELCLEKEDMTGYLVGNELRISLIGLNRILNIMGEKKIDFLDVKSVISLDYEPVFIKDKQKIKMRNIEFLSDDFFYFEDRSFPKIYKIGNEESRVLQKLNYPSALLVEKLRKEESDRLEIVLEQNNIPIAEYTKEYGLIEIFIEKSNLKNKVEINIGYSSKSIFENGKYFVPKENKKVLKEIGNIIKKIAANSNSKYKIGENNFQISYDSFIDFAGIIDENYADKVILNMDSDVKKVRNISVDFKIWESDNNLLEFTFKIDNIDEKDYDLILDGIRKEQKFIKLSSGELVKIANKKAEELLGVVDTIQDLEIGNNKISKLKALQLAQISNNLKEDFDKIEEFKQLFQKIKERKSEEPKNLKVELFPYQKIGFNWLKNMYDLGLGGILADDMGLGKTLQMIALISFLQSENKNLKALVVVPTSLLHNWKEEFNRFSEVNPILVEGFPKDREKIIIENENGVFITTYHTLRNDIKIYKDKEFDIAVLDEAQNIKNITAQVKKAVMKINSKVNFALTGTPMENNILELWSIFDFIQAGYLGSITKFKKSYKEVFENPGSKKIVNLRKIIAPFILRRNKKEVLTELPDKIETNTVVSLSDDQKKLYLAYVKQAKKEMESFDENENNRIKILAILTKLRQICNSPALFNENYDGEIAKIEVLRDLMPDIIENGHRVLIFSQFVGTLKEIEKELKSQGVEYFYIDGSVKSKERMEISKRFNKGEKKAVLISLKAGGTGLNLIGADVVIHYDPWWNVAVENQASDRAYRIGQKNSVQVIKLVTEGTIEEKIIKIQENKKLLSQNLLEGKDGEKMLFEMSDSELMELIK